MSAASLYHDVEPCAQLGLPCVWINRLDESSDLPRAGELFDLAGLPGHARRAGSPIASAPMDLLGPPEAFDAKKVEEGVRLILEGIGEDPDRGGLRETPARVARMYEEIFAGIGKDASQLVTVVEGADYDEMIMVRDIPMQSFCEHHLIPFAGRAHVAYIPNKAQQITGLSKIARVVDLLAKKPQVQERLTTEIAEAIDRALSPRGVFVVIEAEHFCMTMRGIKKPGVGDRDVDRARALPLRRPDPPGGDGPHRHALTSGRRTTICGMGLVWRCRDRELPLGERTLVMGIVNVTPDSFSDGGMFEDADAAVTHGLRAPGGGRRRPRRRRRIDPAGLRPGRSDEERARVLPVIEGLRREAPEALLSVDTRKAAVASEALAAGADVVNDIGAGTDPDMFDVVASAGGGDGPDAHAGRAEDDAGGSALRRRRRGGARVPRRAHRGGGRGRDRPRPPLRRPRDRLREEPRAQPRACSVRSARSANWACRCSRACRGSASSASSRGATIPPIDSRVPSRARSGVRRRAWRWFGSHDVGPTVRALRVVDAIARERP